MTGRLGRRGAWAGLAGTIVAVGLLEALVVHLIVARFAPGAVLAVDMVLGSVTAAVCLAIASPLWMRHRVASTAATLRFGWLSRVEVPWSAVTSMEPVTAPRLPEQGIAMDDGHLTMILDASADAIRMTFDRPLAARFRVVRRVEVTSVVVGSADPWSAWAAIQAASHD